MRLSGYQPHFFPRLHYFARMLDSDVFEFSDYVQFVKKHKFADADGGSHRGKSYQADTPIKLGTGLTVLTVPAGQHENLPINQTKVSPNGWEKKHLKSLFLGYRNASQYDRLAPQLEMLFDGNYDSLADLNIRTALWALGVLSGEIDQSKKIASLDEINEWLAGQDIFRLKKIVLISETEISPSGSGRDATDWIIDMCNYLGSDEYYYGGTSASAYMNFDKFKAANVSLIQQDWKCPTYAQQFIKLGFTPNLSILDLVFNEEPANAQKILKGIELKTATPNTAEEARVHA